MNILEDNWPDKIRRITIEKSAFYPGREAAYQFGYYDGFQKAIECLTELKKENESVATKLRTIIDNIHPLD